MVFLRRVPSLDNVILCVFPLYRVGHKSVNTRVRHKSVNTSLSHEQLVVRTWLTVYALPQTTIYREPGAYDKPFMG